MAGANLNKRKKTMASPGSALSPNTIPSPINSSATTTNHSSFALTLARVGFLVLFAAIPILAVKLELTGWMLVLALCFGVAAIFFWAKVPSVKFLHK